MISTLEPLIVMRRPGPWYRLNLKVSQRAMISWDFDRCRRKVRLYSSVAAPLLYDVTCIGTRMRLWVGVAVTNP